MPPIVHLDRECRVTQATLKSAKPRLKLHVDGSLEVIELKTAAAVRAEFVRKGISIAAWAKENQFSRQLVYEILEGNKRRRCTRGQSHRIAVLLGIKAGELTTSTSAMNVRVHGGRR